MLFEINFNQNKDKDDDFLLTLGAKWVSTGENKYPPFEVLEIELNTFEELEVLLEKIDKEKKSMYTALVSFDNPTIFLDKDV